MFPGIFDERVENLSDVNRNARSIACEITIIILIVALSLVFHVVSSSP